MRAVRKRKRETPPPTPAAADNRKAGVTGRISAGILALGATAYGLTVAITSQAPGPSTWGFDTPGYLSAPWRALTLGLIGVGAALLAAAAIRPRQGGEGPGRERPLRTTARAGLWVALILLLSAAMWLLRVRSYFLGDQQVWLDNIHADRFLLFNEPLAALAWRGYTLLLRILGIPPTEKWLAAFPILCGIASAPLVWRISGCIAGAGNTRVLASILIATLASTQLYCGYFESYAIVTLAVLLYLLLGLLHARGEGPIVLVGLSLALAVATHLVALLFVPSYLHLILRARTGAMRRAVLVLLPLLLVGGVIWLVDTPWRDILRPFHVLGVALLTPGSASLQPAPLVSHVANFACLVFLIMPVPALLLLSGIFPNSWESRTASPERRFLAMAAIPGVIVAAALVLPGSPAQDWDLLSVALLPAALLGICLATSRERYIHSRGFRFGLAVLALGSLLAFLLVNANEDAGIHRFKMIIHPSIGLSGHERAYGNEKLAKYYLSKQEPDSTLLYAQRALAAEPRNPRYHATLGTALYNVGRYGEAARHLEEAIRGGLKRGEIHYQLGLCYMREHRFVEAAAEFRAAADLGAKPEYLHYLGMAMLAAGDPMAALSVWNFVLEHWPGYEPTVRAAEHHFGALEAPPSR